MLADAESRARAARGAAKRAEAPTTAASTASLIGLRVEVADRSANTGTAIPRATRYREYVPASSREADRHRRLDVALPPKLGRQHEGERAGPRGATRCGVETGAAARAARDDGGRGAASAARSRGPRRAARQSPRRALARVGGSTDAGLAARPQRPVARAISAQKSRAQRRFAPRTAERAEDLCGSWPGGGGTETLAPRRRHWRARRRGGDPKRSRESRSRSILAMNGAAGALPIAAPARAEKISARGEAMARSCSARATRARPLRDVAGLCSQDSELVSG